MAAHVIGGLRGVLKYTRNNYRPFRMWTSRTWEPGLIYMGTWKNARRTIVNLETGYTWAQFVREFRSVNRYHPGRPASVEF